MEKTKPLRCECLRARTCREPNSITGRAWRKCRRVAICKTEFGKLVCRDCAKYEYFKDQLTEL